MNWSNVLLHSKLAGLTSLWTMPILCRTNRHCLTSFTNFLDRYSGNYLGTGSQSSRWNWTASSYAIRSKGILASNVGPMRRTEHSLLMATYLITLLIRSVIVVCSTALRWSLATNSLFARLLRIIYPYLPPFITLLYLI
jgi:hypothetical protein